MILKDCSIGLTKKYFAPGKGNGSDKLFNLVLKICFLIREEILFPKRLSIVSQSDLSNDT